MRNWNAFILPAGFFAPITFYITYEELKPCIPFQLLEELSLFILPMRNWNIIIDIKLVIFCTSFYITYEELKLFIDFRRWENCNCLFILPMRNWNSTYVNGYIRSGSTFLYYLWGIETIEAWNIFQILVVHFLYYLWGIETPYKSIFKRNTIKTFYITYEELKLNLLFIVDSWLFTFYITYEELKQN